MDLNDAVNAFFGHYKGEVGGYFTKDGAMPIGGKREKRLGNTAEDLMRKYSSSSRSITALNETEDYVIEVNYNSATDNISLTVYDKGRRENHFRSDLEDINIQEWARELDKIRKQYEETEKMGATI